MLQGILVLMYLFFITPVQVGLMVEWGQGLPAAHVGVMLWGMRKVFHLPLKRDEQGRLYLASSLKLPKRKKQRSKRELLLSVMKLWYLRKKITPLIRMRLFKIQTILSLPDAGQTALLCAGLSALFGALFPHGESRFLPSYRGENRGRAACIVEGRLGTIGMAFLVWKAHQTPKKEASPWNIPSPN